MTIPAAPDARENASDDARLCSADTRPHPDMRRWIVTVTATRNGARDQHQWGPPVHTARGERVAVRRITHSDWVICEHALGEIKREHVLGFVRQVGPVWEVVIARDPMIRHYERTPETVLHWLVEHYSGPLPLVTPRVTAPDARAFSDDELGVLCEGAA